MCDSFDEMGLREEILKGIYGYGFEQPSEIQKRAILPLISGNDLIAQAQSGTGKTGTFSIGTLQRVDETINSPQIMILAPTRELAMQINNVVMALAEHTKITTTLCCGGMRGKSETRIRTHYVIGTPGRIFDYLKKNIIDNKNIKSLILDEADEMLSAGFSEQISNIMKFIPKAAQIGLFSATMPDEMLALTEEFMQNPERILIPVENLTLDGIKQYYLTVDKEDQKFQIICDLYSTITVTQCMIFCATKQKVKNLANNLRRENFTVSEIYGEMPQDERNHIMSEFRHGKTRTLVCSTLLSRGVDIPSVSLVIMTDPCRELEQYPHIIGRTGRYGKKGVSILLLSLMQVDFKKAIENHYHTYIEELPSDIDEVLKSIT